MANISITRRCRRQCSYCFAKHELNRSALEHMSAETFKAALAFLKRSRIPEARLLGGEPTEHPLFRDYVELARAEGFRILIFSGGLIPDPVLDYLEQLPPAAFRLLLNAADPASDRDDLLLRQEQICVRLGQKVMVGVNVYSRTQNPLYVLEWVERWGLHRTVRLGIAHPIWGGANALFRLRRPRPVEILETFFESAAAVGIQVCFDCGFTPCMFSRAFVEAHADLFEKKASAELAVAAGDERGELLESFEAVGVRCSPVVDILPEGDGIACYALSRAWRLPMPEQGTQSDWVAAFDRELSSILPAGCFRDCAACDYRTRGMCGGGCRARRASRLRPVREDGGFPAPRQGRERRDA